jgi:predicted phosphodiesterase
MRIWILSDLHLESSTWRPPTSMKGRGDVVVLAGDVHGRLSRSVEWAALERLPGGAFEGMEVILVPGNHEFYFFDIDAEALAGRRAAKETGIHLLDCGEAVIDGVRFLGCSLWTDYALYGDAPAAMNAAARGINDHRLITRQGKRFAPADALDRHVSEKIWLAGALARKHDGPTVVVTHHCVSRRSVHPKWGKVPISAAFSSNLDGLVEGSGAALWVHGHTHDSFDYMLGGTRVICNPKGYGPSYATGIPENTAFDPRLVIEIEGGRDA